MSVSEFNFSAGILLYRTNTAGVIEAAFQLRDNLPGWGQAGIGARQGNETMLECAMRETSEETNYPVYEQAHRIRYLMGTRGFYAHNGARVEDSDFFILDVGDFPLEQKGEGVALEFFPLTTSGLPANMFSYTRSVMHYAIDCLDTATGDFRCRPETKEDAYRLPLTYHSPYHDFARKNRKEFVGLELFDTNQTVIARRRNYNDTLAGRELTAPALGLLRYDPYAAGLITTALQNFAAGADDRLTVREIAAARGLQPVNS